MNIHYKRGHVWPFDDLPDRSIALDGACPGPAIDAARRRYSFDHHAGCWRLCTSATCRQVYDALLLGLDPEGMSVFVNDDDGDTVLAVWLLRHAARWKSPVVRERLLPLVECVGVADAHGPAYPLPFVDLWRTFRAVVCAPDAADERDPHGRLDRRLGRLEAWWQRGLHVGEDAAVARPSVRVEPAGSIGVVEAPRDVHLEWASLYAQGFDRIVVHTEEGQGRHRYVLARRSDLVAGFDLPAIYQRLNEAEATARAEALGPSQTWGGSTSVGGSPRDGSVLDRDDVLRVVARAVTEVPDFSVRVE